MPISSFTSVQAYPLVSLPCTCGLRPPFLTMYNRSPKLDLSHDSEHLLIFIKSLDVLSPSRDPNTNHSNSTREPLTLPPSPQHSQSFPNSRTSNTSPPTIPPANAVKLYSGNFHENERVSYTSRLLLGLFSSIGCIEICVWDFYACDRDLGADL